MKTKLLMAAFVTLSSLQAFATDREETVSDAVVASASEFLTGGVEVSNDINDTRTRLRQGAAAILTPAVKNGLLTQLQGQCIGDGIIRHMAASSGHVTSYVLPVAKSLLIGSILTQSLADTEDRRKKLIAKPSGSRDPEVVWDYALTAKAEYFGRTTAAYFGELMVAKNVVEQVSVSIADECLK